MRRRPEPRSSVAITENVMLNDIEGALQTMTALKELDDQCHEVQGFLLSRPLDNCVLVRMMHEQIATTEIVR